MGEQVAVDSDCLVPKMTNGELYECCVSDAAAATCQVFGSINAVIVGLIVSSFFFLVFTSGWYQYRLLLWFTFLFQLLPATWRAIFYLYAGYPDHNNEGTYRTIRESDSGDFVVSLVGFAMYLYQLTMKYEKATTDPSYDHHALRNRLAFGFWGFFGLYSVWWYSAHLKSKAEADLLWVDFATVIWFPALIPVYYIVTNNLIKSINTLLGYAEDAVDAPGVPQIMTIFKLHVSGMILRTIFVPLQDIQKIYDIDALSKSHANWPLLMAVQCTTQIFACGVVFYSIYLINEAESEISAQPNGAKQLKQGKQSANAKVQLSVLDGSDLIVVHL